MLKTPIVNPAPAPIVNLPPLPATPQLGTVALATRASGLPEGRPPAASRDPSSSAPKKGRAGGKSDYDTSVTTSVSRHDNVPLVSSTVDIMKNSPASRIDTLLFKDIATLLAVGQRASAAGNFQRSLQSGTCWPVDWEHS